MMVSWLVNVLHGEFAVTTTRDVNMHIVNFESAPQHYTITLIGLAALLLAGCATVGVQADMAAILPGAQVVQASAPSRPLDRRQQLQALFDAAVLDQTIYHKYDNILVRWPAEMTHSGQITLRIQKPDGRIYAERAAYVEADSVTDLGEAYVLRDGHYYVVLMPPVTEYYIGSLRVDRRLDFEVRVQQP